MSTNENVASAEEEALINIKDAITAALLNVPASEVLSILTGAFVGLTVELVRRQGHDATQEIKIDGGDNRNITIHAVKAAIDPN